MDSSRQHSFSYFFFFMTPILPYPKVRFIRIQRGSRVSGALECWKTGSEAGGSQKYFGKGRHTSRNLTNNVKRNNGSSRDLNKTRALLTFEYGRAGLRLSISVLLLNLHFNVFAPFHQIKLNFQLAIRDNPDSASTGPQNLLRE